MSSTAEQTRNGMSGSLNDPNLFRTQYKPLDAGSPEHRATQQVRQKCQELWHFIESQVIKGQASDITAQMIKGKLLEVEFWANHFATRDKGNQGNTLGISPQQTGGQTASTR